MEEAGSAVESLLKEDPPNAKEGWRRMKGWYQAAAKRGPPPAQATLERITEERTELYSRVPSPGENIPVTVEPAIIDNSVPTEDEIAAAVGTESSIIAGSTFTRMFSPGDGTWLYSSVRSAVIRSSVA